MCKCVMRHDARQMIIFRRLGTHKLSAGRRIVKKVTDGDSRADRAGGVLYIDKPPALESDEGSGIIRSYFGDQFDFRDRRDRGESFAAKAEGPDRGQIVKRSNLGCGVALEGKDRVVPSHSGTIIRNTHQTAAAKLDIYLDTGRS